MRIDICDLGFSIFDGEGRERARCVDMESAANALASAIAHADESQKLVKVKGLTVEQWDRRINDAVNVIIHCWEEWDADAGQAETNAQDPGAWLDAMTDQIKAVLQGMVFDRDGEAAA